MVNEDDSKMMSVVGWIHPKAGGDDEMFGLCLGHWIDTPAARGAIDAQVKELLGELGSAVLDDYAVMAAPRNTAKCAECKREGCYDVVFVVEGDM